MTTIKLTTIINATIEKCFDLSGSIDTHLRSTRKTKETVVTERKTGLVVEGEIITWEAVHFGIRQRLTTKILEMDPPYFFSDKMINGAFKSMYHEHHFSFDDSKTIMTDIFNYETPYGFLGYFFDYVALNRHMRKLLEERNNVIKTLAESH